MDCRKVTHLNAALLSRCRLKVALSDPFSNLEPQSTTLPFALLFHRSHHDFLLGTRQIREDHARHWIFTCGIPLPLEAARLEAQTRTNWRREIRLEGVRLAGEVGWWMIASIGETVKPESDARM